jgi:phenylpropionate dioxygenase-like ring-hydroxylating dioxygenase large terminal subunit
VSGRIPIRGAYQLVSDNLLDLSHTQYLHPILTLPDDPDTRHEYDLLQEGDTITTVFNTRNAKPFGFVNFIWPGAPARIDSFSGVRWQAPANILLKIHFVSLDPAAPAELRIWGAELVTPETETTCHYFWSTARNFRQDDKEFGRQLGEATEQVFTNEDGMMIAEVQGNMGDQSDLMALRPVVLPTDRASIRARMILKKLLRQEDRGVSDHPESAPV